MSGLKFIIKEILMVDYFESLDTESNRIKVLTSELVDVMLNSTEYYN